MVVESHRDLAWKVEHTYGSGSNQLAALAAAAKNHQSKKYRAEFQHILKAHHGGFPSPDRMALL
jgi:hypothetical protein